MANRFFNRVKQRVSGAPGIGDITLGSASSGYVTFADARGFPASATILTSSGDGVRIVYTTSATHEFDAGERVTIAGNSIGGHNGDFLLESVTSNTFTIEDSTSGSGTGGTVVPMDGEVVTYTLTDGVNHETGRGILKNSGTTLERDTVYSSSNAGAKINASAAAIVINTIAREDMPTSGYIRTTRGFWSDPGSDIDVETFRFPADRIFAGDAVKHASTRNPPYGNDWLSTVYASYFMKHSLMAVQSTEPNGKIAFLAATYVEPGYADAVASGLAGIAVNAGLNSVARAAYLESARMGSAADSMAMEIILADFTATLPVVGPYGNVQSNNGIQIATENCFAYTIGDADTVVTPGGQPGGAAIYLTGGTDAASIAARRMLAGIVARENSLYGESGSGLSGPFNFAILPKEFQIKWMVSETDIGAVLRSDRSTGATQAVGLLFKNAETWITGASERRALVVQDDTASGGAINWAFIKNSRASIPVQFGADGSDTNIAVDVVTKGASPMRVMAYAGGQEVVRFGPRSSLDDVSIQFLSGLSGTSKPQISAYDAEATATGDDVNLVLAALNNGRIELLDPVQMPSYAKASLPAAAVAGALIYVTDDVGGAVPAFTDGTDWRRVTDRAVIA